MSRYHKNPTHEQKINVNELLAENGQRLNRLLDQLGNSNRRGTKRHEFEVDYCYAVNETIQAPTYIQDKMAERTTWVVNRLQNFLKNRATGE